MLSQIGPRRDLCCPTCHGLLEQLIKGHVIWTEMPILEALLSPGAQAAYTSTLPIRFETRTTSVRKICNLLTALWNDRSYSLAVSYGLLSSQTRTMSDKFDVWKHYADLRRRLSAYDGTAVRRHRRSQEFSDGSL